MNKKVVLLLPLLISLTSCNCSKKLEFGLRQGLHKDSNIRVLNYKKTKPIPDNTRGLHWHLTLKCTKSTLTFDLKYGQHGLYGYHLGAFNDIYLCVLRDNNKIIEANISSIVEHTDIKKWHNLRLGYCAIKYTDECRFSIYKSEFRNKGTLSFNFTITPNTNMQETVPGIEPIIPIDGTKSLGNFYIEYTQHDKNFTWSNPVLNKEAMGLLA